MVYGWLKSTEHPVAHHSTSLAAMGSRGIRLWLDPKKKSAVRASEQAFSFLTKEN